jgi:hypothetical protein
MTTATNAGFTGGCSCGEVRYRMTSTPMIVHCCHCTWCQRQTGTAFALNAIIETTRVVVESGAPETVLTPSPSEKGQKIARCPNCKIALWSHYAGGGDALAFVRVGTLDESGRFPPDVHIFTSTKQPWVVLPPAARAFPEFYTGMEVWSEDAIVRRKAAIGR